MGVLVLAVILGLGAMFATRRFMSKPVVAEETQEIVVAARDYKEEEVLKADMVKSARMPSKSVPPGAFASFKDVEDRWVKTAMLEGEPIIERKLGPKGSPPGLVANIPKGMRAFAIEVNEQSGVSGFILPGHHVDVVRYEANDNNRQHPGETILQDVMVLASGQTFTRSDEKSLPTHTVTVAVTPEQVGILVAAKAKGTLNLSLRGVNDHDMVAQPKPKTDQNDEEKARRIKLEKELEEVKLALARKRTEVPPPPPPPAKPVVKAQEPRYVLIYRPLLDKKYTEYPAKEAANAAARGEVASRIKAEEEAEPKGFGFGGPAVTGTVAETRGETTRTP
jgi:pilus assembly protein CpaB